VSDNDKVETCSWCKGTLTYRDPDLGVLVCLCGFARSSREREADDRAEGAMKVGLEVRITVDETGCGWARFVDCIEAKHTKVGKDRVTERLEELVNDAVAVWWARHDAEDETG